MGFILEVNITGLCLFVAEADRMHVLMPDTRPGGGAHHREIEVHDTSVSYDSAYEGTGGTGEVRKRAGDLGIDFTPTRCEKGSVDLPRQVVDLDRVIYKRIPRTHLGPNQAEPAIKEPDSLLTRITLPGCYQASPRLGAHWDIGPLSNVEMTPRVTWRVKVLDDALTWNQRPLRKGLATPAPLPPLRPPAGVPLVITISHVPANEGTKVPSFPFEATHFAAMYDLFPSKGYNPFLRQLRPRDRSGQPVAEMGEPLVPPPWGGSPYTCMVAQAPLE